MARECRHVFGNTDTQRQKARLRYELFPGAGNRHCCSGRNRQYRRRIRRNSDRRSLALFSGCGSSRSLAWRPSMPRPRLLRKPVSLHKGRQRSTAVRSTTSQRPLKGSLGKFLAGFFAIAITLALGLLRMYGTVQLDRIYLRNSIRYSCLDRRNYPCDHLRIHFPRRDQATCSRNREAGSYHGCDLPARRTDRPDRKIQVSAGNFRNDLYICIPASGDHRRVFRSCDSKPQ